MNSFDAMKIYAQYQCAMAYVDVLCPSGDRSIGSAFHVGDGVFVTARHVVEGNQVIEVKVTEPVAIDAREFLTGLVPELVNDEFVKAHEEALEPALGHKPLYKHYLKALVISDGPFYSDKNDFDVAVFKVKELHARVPAVPLGTHWDDWVYRVPWQLSDAIVMGYPPVPMVNEPVLVPARAQIHTYVCPRHAPKIHFILSATPRGGFSGGVAIHESGDALGVITTSLVTNGAPEQLGFFAVLSIEAIVGCLKEFGLFPDFQKNRHDSKRFPAPKT